MGNVVEQCIGCQKVNEDVCIAYPNPAMWWEKFKACPLATHTRKVIQQQQGKTRLTIQKKKKTRK